MAKIEGIYLRMYLGFVLLKLNIFKYKMLHAKCESLRNRQSLKCKLLERWKLDILTWWIPAQYPTSMEAQLEVKLKNQLFGLRA